jgi:hypothetical protein
MDTQMLTQERIALNQSTFREANERIESAAVDMSLTDLVPFICECAEPTCTEIVQLKLKDYEAIRQDPRRFFNATGHERLSVDAGAGVVVERRGRFVIVDKVGLAGEVAEARYEELEP